MRSVRFGVVFTANADAAQWTDLARRAEGEGFSTVLVADHLANPMACGPLILAAAAATTTLRVGSYVYCNDFRHPTVLAKEVATIDVLSNGRMEFGVGAGWAKSEYDEVGLPFDAPGVRADRFEESVGVMTSLLAGERVTHAGAHYQLNGFLGSPMPAQQPVPLLIGGGGPRMVRLAGRKANIVGFVPRSLPTGGLDMTEFAPESMDRKVADLEHAVAETGRSDGGPERSVILFGLHRRAANAQDNVAAQGADPDLALTSPFVLVGDAKQIADTITERHDRWGITYYVCFERDFEKLIPVVHEFAR